jgi:hypothetical protein
MSNFISLLLMTCGNPQIDKCVEMKYTDLRVNKESVEYFKDYKYHQCKYLKYEGKNKDQVFLDCDKIESNGCKFTMKNGDEFISGFMCKDL